MTHQTSWPGCRGTGFLFLFIRSWFCFWRTSLQFLFSIMFLSHFSIPNISFLFSVVLFLCILMLISDINFAKILLFNVDTPDSETLFLSSLDCVFAEEIDVCTYLSSKLCKRKKRTLYQLCFWVEKHITIVLAGHTKLFFLTLVRTVEFFWKEKKKTQEFFRESKLQRISFNLKKGP